MSPAVVLASLLSGAVAPGEVRERAAAILRRREYQTELPSAPKPWDLPLGWLEVVMRVLFWAAVAVGVLLVAAWVIRHLGARTREAAPPPPPDPAALAARPLAQAEALAAAGRYGEAIHTLLLRTLEALSRTARLPASLTSREIVARVPLPPKAREALAGLVAAVEVSWFGGADPGAAEWRACLERFHAFLATYREAAR